MSIGGRIARNTLIQFLGKAITTFFGLALLAFLTRNVGQASYGDYITILAYTQFFGIFANFGIDVYILKRISTPHQDERMLVGEAFSLRLTTAIAVMVVAGLISLLFPYSRAVHWGVAIALISTLAQTLNSYFVTVLQARLEMRFAVWTEIIGRAITLALSIVFVLAGKGVLWVVLALTAGSVVNALLSYHFAGRYIAIRPIFKLTAWRSILKEALLISISSMLGYLYFKVDTVLLSILPLHGLDNRVEVAIYGSAYKVLEILLLVPAIFLGSVFPVLSDFLRVKDKRVPLLLQRSVEVMSFFGFPVCIFLLVAAPQTIRFIAGVSYAAAAAPLQILAMAVLVNYFSSVFTYTALTLNKQVALIKVYSVALVFNLCSNLLLIPRYSYHAAAWTTFLTELIVLILPFIICQRAIPMRWQVGRIGRALAASLAMGIVIWFLRNLGFLPIFLIAVTLYSVLAAWLRVLNRADLQLILPAH